MTTVSPHLRLVGSLTAGARPTRSRSASWLSERSKETLALNDYLLHSGQGGIYLESEEVIRFPTGRFHAMRGSRAFDSTRFTVPLVLFVLAVVAGRVLAEPSAVICLKHIASATVSETQLTLMYRPATGLLPKELKQPDIRGWPSAWIEQAITRSSQRISTRSGWWRRQDKRRGRTPQSMPSVLPLGLLARSASRRAGRLRVRRSRRRAAASRRTESDGGHPPESDSAPLAHRATLQISDQCGRDDRGPSSDSLLKSTSRRDGCLFFGPSEEASYD